jgi:hypothetical protein
MPGKFWSARGKVYQNEIGSFCYWQTYFQREQKTAHTQNPQPPPLSTNLKKKKGFFFSFRFKTTSLRHCHIGRMSEALCDLGRI